MSIIILSQIQPSSGGPPAPRTCARCVMDTADEAICFGQDGVCNHCHEYDTKVRQRVLGGEAGRMRLAEIVAQIKADGAGKPYDCIIGVSGGVDSTYVAWQVKELGLRPLAVHLDNGWNSEIAVSNISAALQKLEKCCSRRSRSSSRCRGGRRAAGVRVPSPAMPHRCCPRHR